MNKLLVMKCVLYNFCSLQVETYVRSRSFVSDITHLVNKNRTRALSMK